MRTDFPKMLLALASMATLAATAALPNAAMAQSREDKLRSGYTACFENYPNYRRAESAARKLNFDFNRRITAGIENFPTMYIHYICHFTPQQF